MGIYLNPDNRDFQLALNSEIYIDKTMLIAHTNKKIDTENRFICISRPRRFGKSMAANMLTAYYSRGCDSAEMFAPYKIAETEIDLHDRNTSDQKIWKTLRIEYVYGNFYAGYS